MISYDQSNNTDHQELLEIDASNLEVEAQNEGRFVVSSCIGTSECMWSLSLCRLTIKIWESKLGNIVSIGTNIRFVMLIYWLIYRTCNTLLTCEQALCLGKGWKGNRGPVYRLIIYESFSIVLYELISSKVTKLNWTILKWARCFLFSLSCV